jgi:DNA-binding MarR family transcriptional regulator
MTASANTTPSELASRLRLAIARTARRLRQEGGMGLSPSMTAALATIERHGPLTPSRLAEIERIQRPTATRVIARLEESGLVGRTLDPADGRSRLIALTAEGGARLRAIRTRRNAYLARRLAGLSTRERMTLEDAAQILERMLDAERA